jgi:hypothetical protein
VRWILPACITLAALISSPPASAHHSTANFDMTKTATVIGTVTYFAFTNPHSYFDLDVTWPVGWRDPRYDRLSCRS